MKTVDISPEEMTHNIARFDDLVANKAKTGNKIPPEARERMTARATKTVIADPTASDTPWGAGRQRRSYFRAEEFYRCNRRM